MRRIILQVAREAALKFNPDAQIRAYHGNIKGREFDLDFVSEFSLVMNALDNLDARRYHFLGGLYSEDFLPLHFI